MSLLTPLLCGLVLATAAPRSETTSCRRIHSPGAAARCAAANAPAARVADADVEVAHARRDAARVILPEHPTVDVTVVRRRGPDDRDVNVYGTIRQPIEIGGQRRTRTRHADAQLEVARAEIASAHRNAASLALGAYYDAIAAQRRGAEMTKVLDVTRKLESLAAEKVGAGASAGIEHELARASRVLAQRRVLDARREEKVARARLARMVGVAAKDLDVAGDLVPLDVSRDEVSLRPEVAVVSAQARAHDRRTAMLRRSRVPTPALIATVQRDGFGELVAGGGISLGIPLPSPLGPNKRAEIAESVALAQRTRADQYRIEHGIALERETAAADVDARRETLEIYEPAITQSASVALDALAEAMVAGQLDLRDALMAQRTLLELLQGRLDAEHELCLAALDAARASGADLEALQ